MFPEREADVRAAGRRLRTYLPGRFVAGHMKANEVTLIAYLHSASGGHGLEDMGINPDRSGNHHALLQSVLDKEYDAPMLYEARIPLYNKFSCQRESQSVPIRLPHETYAAEFVEHVEPEGDDPESVKLGTSYTEHPVVKAALQQGVRWSRILPLAVYTDGVKYTKNDSYIGYFCQNIRTGKKC